MVRRIVPDSDFESDDDNTPIQAEKEPGHAERSSPLSNSDVSPAATPRRRTTNPPPNSTRRVVRQRDAQPEPVGTYDYDSDIYTEESSMGSFIVRTDSESEDETNENDHQSSTYYILIVSDHDLVSETEEVLESDSSSLCLSPLVTSTQRLLSPPPEDFLSEALLVQLSPSSICLTIATLNPALVNKPLFLKRYPHLPHGSNTPHHHIKNHHPNSGINKIIIPGSTKTHLTNHHRVKHFPPRLQHKSTKLRKHFFKHANN